MLVCIFSQNIFSADNLYTKKNKKEIVKKETAIDTKIEFEKEANTGEIYFKNKHLWGAAITISQPVTLISVGMVNWWKLQALQFSFDHFKFYDRGWFEKNSYEGGFDKIGHFYANYLAHYMYQDAYEWAGYSRNESIIYTSIITFLSFNLVEFIDAFTFFGWEYADSATNAAGQVLAVFSQIYSLDRFFQLRISWFPSRAYKNNKIKKVKFLKDYDGQRFFLVIDNAGISDYIQKDFSIFRYIVPAVYYDTRGYSPKIDIDSTKEKERNIGFALVADFSALTKDYAADNIYLKGLASFFKFFQPSVFLGYGYDFNQKKWHFADLSLFLIKQY